MATTTLKTKLLPNLSALRKVFSLLARWEKVVTLVLLGAIAGSLYWNWQIFYVAHTREVPANGGKLVEGLVGQPSTINPVLATTPTDLTLVHAIFSGLYTYDAKGELVPDLAEAMPEVGEDGKHYTVHLKPNLTWHDGKPVTADDVLFTIAEIQNEQIQSPLRNLWLATSVQKKDDQTVTFVTRDISSPFLHNLTVPLIPAHAWQSVAPENFGSNSLNLKPLGSGAFAIREIEKNANGAFKRMTLASFARSPHAPKLDSITVVFYDSQEDLRQGYIAQEISTIGIGTNDALTESGNGNTVHIPLPQYQAVFLNLKSPSTGDPLVRQALRLTTDSTAITQAAWGSRAKPISDPPLGLITTSTTTTPTQSIEAEKLLTQAGWLKQASGIRKKGTTTLHVSLVTSDNPSFKVAANLLAQSWQGIGVEVSLQTVPANELINNHVRPRQYDALLFSQRMTADPDPFAFWHSSQAKDPGLNVSNFSSSEADRLITDARTTTDAAIRTADYAKLVNILKTELPAIYLNQSLYTYIFNPAIRGTLPSILVDPTWRLGLAAGYYTETTRTWH